MKGFKSGRCKFVKHAVSQSVASFVLRGFRSCLENTSCFFIFCAFAHVSVSKIAKEVWLWTNKK